MDDANDFVGLKGVNFKEHMPDSVELFKMFWPGDDREHLIKINDAIHVENERQHHTRKNPRKIRDIIVEEYYIFIGIMILGSVIYSDGTMLWNYENGSVIPCPLIGKYMAKGRFKELRKFFSFLMADREKEAEGS